MISQICNHSLARTCPHSKARKHWSLRFFGFCVSVTGVASLLRGYLRLTTPGRLSGRDSGTFGVAAVMSDLDFVGVPTEINEPHRDKTNKMACAPSEDSDQPGHPPSLIRVFAVCMKKGWVLSYPLSAQRRLWSDWGMPRLIWVFPGRTCHFVGFVMSWLKWFRITLEVFLINNFVFSPFCLFVTNYFFTEIEILDALCFLHNWITKWLCK